MSSDADYASFLDKANQDTGASKASTQQSSSQQQKYSTQSVDTDVPAAVKDVDEYYTSEADEPFEPVSLKWSGGGELGAGMVSSGREECDKDVAGADSCGDLSGL